MATVDSYCVLTFPEPPGADPHAGWCGEGQLDAGHYPIIFFIHTCTYTYKLGHP